MTTDSLAETIKVINAQLCNLVLAQTESIANQLNPELLQALQCKIFESIAHVLSEEFQQLQAEVLIRRQVNVNQLMTIIRERG